MTLEHLMDAFLISESKRYDVRANLALTLPAGLS